jgi:ABC-type transport system involved in multi-copper enzyme maturation permease subunit
VNPVLRRELQERFRTLRSPILLSIWVLAAGVLTFLAYVVAQSAARDRFTSFGFGGLGTLFASASMGRFMLHVLLIGLLTAVVFVVPGQAAVAIVGEKERQTLQLLQVSQLNAWRIVWGKLSAALAYVLLLLVATTPLLVIPILLGGVDLLDLVGGVLLVVTASIMIGSVSIWVSARARSVQGAVLGSYMWTVALVFGTLALLVAEFLLIDADLGVTRFQSGVARDNGRELYSAVINPYVGLVDASSDVLAFEGDLVASPYIPFRAALIKRQGFSASAASGDVFDSRFNRFGEFEEFAVAPGFRGDVFPGPGIGQPQQVNRPDNIRPPAWPGTVAFELGVSALALYGTTRLVRAPATKRRRYKRKPGHAS